VENLSVAINAANRVIYQNTFVDTPAVDFGNENLVSSGPIGQPGQLPFLNYDGYFALQSFDFGNPAGSDVFFDNARVSQTTPVNSAPQAQQFVPADGTNFVSLVSSNIVSFHVLDDTNTPVDNIVLTLNGVRYTNGHPAVTITPTTAISRDRTVVVTNILVPNQNYVGSIQATDN